MKQVVTSPANISVIIHPDLGQVRSVTVKGQLWFVAKDICDILGIQNSSNSIAVILDADEKGIEKIYTLGGIQEMTTVNESGLYALLMRSNKPNAKIFRKWVTSEVLPSIRRQGFYVHPSAALTTVQTKRLQRVMRESVARYIIAEDIRKCSRKFGMQDYQIKCVLNGSSTHNDIMLDLQTRALTNQQKWSNAYSVERMTEINKTLANN